MENKKNKIIYILLLVTIGVFAFLYFTEKKDRQTAEEAFLLEKKEALRILSEKLNKEFGTKTNQFKNEIEILKTQEKQIQYVPYTKTIYIDRTLDEALDVFSNHSANRKTEKQN